MSPLAQVMSHDGCVSVSKSMHVCFKRYNRLHAQRIFHVVKYILAVDQIWTIFSIYFNVYTKGDIRIGWGKTS